MRPGSPQARCGGLLRLEYPARGEHTHWTVYLDGSFRDGPTEELGRTGWGFIAYDTEGRLQAAAAFGVPPPWIRSIHGAELWALFAALRCAAPGVKVRSDRKAVVDTFQAGKGVATRSDNEYARLWSMVFATCDDGQRGCMDARPHLGGRRGQT